MKSPLDKSPEERALDKHVVEVLEDYQITSQRKVQLLLLTQGYYTRIKEQLDEDQVTLKTKKLVLKSFVQFLIHFSDAV